MFELKTGFSEPDKLGFSSNVDRVASWISQVFDIQIFLIIQHLCLSECSLFVSLKLPFIFIIPVIVCQVLLLLI